MNWFIDTNRAWRFDEALERFGQMVSGEHQVILMRLQGIERDVFSRMQLTPAPMELVSAADAVIREKPDETTLRFSERELPFLQLAVRLCGFVSARLELHLQKSGYVGKVSEDSILVHYFGDMKFYFQLAEGRTTIRHELLSYGQKRLLALLYYLAANPDHAIADELVNGLHHEWIEALIDELRERQTFLSSQNPLLLDYMEFESVDQVMHSFVHCGIDQDKNLVWRSLHHEEAQSFYNAYQAGIQQVGEILLTKGLW